MKSSKLVRRIVNEIAALTRRANQSLSDEDMDEVCEGLPSSSARLINALALDSQDIELDLAILCRRLRDQLDPEDYGAVVNILLAESIRDDLLLMAPMKS